MDISASAIQALFNQQQSVTPLERAIVALRATRNEVVACADHLEDADCRRHYLRDLFRSLPLDLLAWQVMPEDRLVSAPQWAEMGKDARNVATWAMGPAIGRPYADERDVRAALQFFEWAEASVDETDEVEGIAHDAASACRYLLGLIEQDEIEAALAEQWERFKDNVYRTRRYA